MTETQSDTAAAAAAVEAIATGHEGTLGEQIQNYFRRIRSGEMGMLPALAGTLVLGVMFSFLSEFFLTNKNIANLLTQTAALMILAIALTFLLIMAEIDLAAGITGGVGMVGNMSVVNLDQAEVDAIANDLKDDGILKPANIPPSPNESLLGG